MPDIALPAYPTTPAAASAVVELRQYALRPGRRDELIDLFESRFVAPLEASGQRLHGEFRDDTDPNRFVWMRGYSGLDERARSLTDFYGGPAWKANRDAANATMVDVGNVLLLKPVESPGFSLAKKMTALMVATVYLLRGPVDDGFLRFFRERVEPAMAAAGAPAVAKLATLNEPNNFPRLAVREGEHAFVWFAFGSPAEYRLHQKTLAESRAWSAAQGELGQRLASPPTRLELVPTARSLRRNGTQFSYSLDVTGSVDDFDFLDGKWEMVNRRLVKRGVGSNEWDTFPASVRAYVLMGGVTNVDEVVFPTKGWSGTTFRHFDLEKRQWSIYWVNTRTGKMDLPGQVGGFDGDVGLFYGEDVDEGRPVKVVYKWTRVGPDGARWEQAFSYDDGKTWETNWVNEHRRVK